MNHLFTSQRLGFRNWTNEDFPKMCAVSGDPKVMKFFPAKATETQTGQFIDRMKSLFDKKGYCYFAVDRLDTQEFVGFIGLMDTFFESDYTPCVDIGWRLGPQHWNLGFATEGASRCLEFAFNEKRLDIVRSFAPTINLPSIKVMEKIGMSKLGEFDHAMLIDNDRLKRCVAYEVLREQTTKLKTP